MSALAKGTKRTRLLFALRRYAIFFLLMSFIITCCMLLFLHMLEKTTGLAFSEADIGQAAILTFINVVVLSLICTVIDGIRRKFMVGRLVQRIVNAADKLMKGELSARIQPMNSVGGTDGFDVIIGYFNKMAEELSGIETLRTDFIANVSHELKTPLAIMQNYGTMLQQPNLPDGKRMEYAKAVSDGSQSLADLITNILKLNKLENQQIFPEKQVYDLGNQLYECLLSFENMWENKRINIITEVDEAVCVETDAELLTLVWNNLFSNALKFTEPGGSVSLSLKKEGNYAVVQVADTGCGISPEVGKHIFDKFYQGDTSHATKGNGLGLALVKRIVDIVGADISVDSEVGKGSTFTVKIRSKAGSAPA